MQATFSATKAVVRADISASQQQNARGYPARFACASPAQTSTVKSLTLNSLRVKSYPRLTRGTASTKLVVRASNETEAETGDGRLNMTWQELSDDLRVWKTEGKLKPIEPKDADFKWQEDEWVFVDVQTEEDFDKVHAIGTVNIPLFTPIQGSSWVQNQRKFLFALNGNFNPTEENPELIEAFEVQCDEDKTKPIIVMCGTGGDLEANGVNPHGIRSRSLIAAHRLIQAGFTQVYWVDGGVRRWFREQLATTLTHDEVF